MFHVCAHNFTTVLIRSLQTVLKSSSLKLPPPLHIKNDIHKIIGYNKYAAAILQGHFVWVHGPPLQLRPPEFCTPSPSLTSALYDAYLKNPTKLSAMI